MKRIKYVLSLVVIIAMLSTVCMAATVGLDSATVEYDNAAIDVTYKIATTFETSYTTAMVYYNKDAWTISNVASDIPGAFAGDDGNGIINIMVTAPATGTADTAFVKFTATAKAGVDVIGEQFKLSGLTILDGTGMGIIEDGSGADIVLTVTEPAPAGPAAPTYGTPVHDYSDVTVGDVIYQNVYVGTYTATPDTGATIAKVGVKAGETVVGEKDITVDGDATVSFKIALLGVEDGKDVGLTAFAEYAE